jgi:hypothetical protein
MSKYSSSPRKALRTIILLLVGVSLLLCVGFWLFGLIPFSSAARLVELKGMVQTQEAKADRWEAAHLNQLLTANDWVRTGSDSGARLRFFDVSTVELEEETEVTVAKVSKRRGGQAVDVVLKVWMGKASVRAVRFVDPSTSFRVDTPTASTVVRGARFTAQVEEDGSTQIDVQEGFAEVEVKDEVVSLEMGQRITLEPDGMYDVERIFEPDQQEVIDKVREAWYASGDTFRLELTEQEVNQFLVAQCRQPDFSLENAQVWFLEDEARVAATVVDPARFDLSAALSFCVVDGEIEPEVKDVAFGVALPLPRPMLKPALNLIMRQLEERMAETYEYVTFEEVRIEDRRIIISGIKVTE